MANIGPISIIGQSLLKTHPDIGLKTVADLLQLVCLREEVTQVSDKLES